MDLMANVAIEELLGKTSSRSCSNGTGFWGVGKCTGTPVHACKRCSTYVCSMHVSKRTTYKGAYVCATCDSNMSDWMTHSTHCDPYESIKSQYTGFHTVSASVNPVLPHLQHLTLICMNCGFKSTKSKKLSISSLSSHSCSHVFSVMELYSEIGGYWSHSLIQYL